MVKRLSKNHSEMIAIAETLPAGRFGKVHLIGLNQPPNQLGKEKATDLFPDVSEATKGLRAVGGKQAGRRSQPSVVQGRFQADQVLAVVRLAN